MGRGTLVTSVQQLGQSQKIDDVVVIRLLLPSAFIAAEAGQAGIDLVNRIQVLLPSQQ